MNNNSELDPQTAEGRLAFQTPEESGEYEAWIDAQEAALEAARDSNPEPDYFLEAAYEARTEFPE